MKQLLCLLFVSHLLAAQPLTVRIQPQANGYRLLVNGQPYTVKGFVGASQFDLAKAYGANSVRTYGGRDGLDEAQRHGLTALVGLPIPGERDGMDWNDDARKAALKAELLGTVEALKNHPAVLIWDLGNELDWIPPGKPYNLKLWDFLNDVAHQIHQIDPNHPVMTVVGTSDMPKKLDELARQCPDLNLLGLNAYADLGTSMAHLRTHWKRPYMVTEWGPNGHWEVPKTTWKVPIEQSSTAKAAAYRQHYQRDIRPDSAYCLGSYVFYWHHKQEITHTWYGMFDEAGNATETVEAMRELWRGDLPSHRTPKLDTCFFVGLPNPRDYRFRPGQTATVSLRAHDPDRDRLHCQYEIRPEATYASYAGQGEKAAATVSQQTLPNVPAQWTITLPDKPGPYRLFIKIVDPHRQIAVVNLPFLVE